MSYINPPYGDCFKELCAAMPLFYLDVYEMREILKAQGRLADGVVGATEQVLDNNFILLSDEPTVKKWEGMLKTSYDEPMTLGQRKNAIIGFVCGQEHIGEPEIRAIIAQYTPEAVTVAFALGVIYITIDGAVIGEETMLETLLRRIPAHLALKIRLNIRRVFRQTLSISYGGAIITGQAPQFVAEPRSSTLTLRITRGGTTTPVITGEPHTQPREATVAIQVGHGGAVTKEISAEPHTEPRTALSPLLVGHSGVLAPTVTAEPPEVKRAATGLKTGGRGVFFQTRIKSKLIKTEED